MNTKLVTRILLAAAVAASPLASADNQPAQPINKEARPTANQPAIPAQATSPDAPTVQSSPGPAAPRGTRSSQLDASELTKLTQQAMSHITAAEMALANHDTAAAKSALSKSEQALSNLYNSPAADRLMTEFDQALEASRGKPPAAQQLDLAPLRATVSSYQTYVDPEVIAGVAQAQQRANEGDIKGAEDALRLARNRTAIDLAFVPVEEAYARVLGAERALQNKDTKTATRLLRNVPIVVSRVQVSAPLVPVRLKLTAAADAAEANQWDRSRALIGEANQAVQQLQRVAQGSELTTELKPIAEDLARLTHQAQVGPNPAPEQIRELAKRTRSIGNNEQG